MKTQIKRFSKSALAVVLTLCMLVSCMTVGLIATDAAKVTSEEEVGATTYRYLWYDMTNNNGQLSALSNKVTLSSTDGNYYTGSFSSNGNNIHFIINNSSTAHTSSSLNSTTTVTVKGSVASWTRRYENSGSYGVEGQLASGNTYYIGYNVSANTVIVGSSSSDTSGGGSTSDEDWYLIGHQFDTAWNTSGESCQMTKDPSTGYYYYEKTFTANTNYFRVHDGANQYGPANENVITLGTKYTLSTSNSGKAVQISNSLSGDYVVWWDSSNKQTWVVAKETTYPVTFSATNGTIIPNGSNNIGVSTEQDISATADAGYKFKEWQTAGVTMTNDTANGDGRTAKVVSKATPTTRYVKAIFEKKTLNISVTQPTAGGTISSDKSTAQVGDTVTITAVPATGYSLSAISYSSTAGSGTASGTGNTRTFTMPGADTTVTATFAKTNYTISKTVNPDGSGTVTVKKGSSTGSSVSQYNIGDTLYLTASANAAYTFKDFTVTYGDGTTETKANNTTIDMTGKTGNITVQGNFTKKPTYKVAVKSNDTSLGTLTASPAEAYQGQTVTITAVENTGTFSKMSFTGITKQDVTTKTATFTMPGNAVTVNATFTEYSAQSNFYYNSYGSNGQPASTHYGARMTEAKINGETYSYYHVTGRTESDQLFTVSYESPVYNNYNTYFSIYSGWESAGVKALFYATDGKNLGDWQDMTYDGADSTDKKKFRISIPDGARSVRFKNGAGSDQTDELYFTSGNNAWYNSGTNFSDVTGYNSSNPVEENFWENFNSSKYTNAFNSGGFNNHNASRGESHAYTKPNNLDESQRGDYYVLVLYSGKTYTINGETKTISNDPEIIWLPELPDNSDKAIIYAKDGTLRSGSQTFADHATTVAASGGTTGTRKDNDYSLLKLEKDGSTVTVTTTIDEGDWRSNYYVKGFNINGVTPELYEYNSNGTYSVTFTLGEDNISFDGGEVDYINDRYVEITPIYYLKNSPNSVTFYIRGFDDTVKASWGDTIAAYPFYNGAGGTECAFGGYPGQPLINYGGKLFIDVPLSVTNSSGNECTIQGITMSNNYWDRIHGTTTSEGNLLHVKAVTTHAQTYDYDDFSKIFTEVKEQNKSPETIVFDFKYRTAQNNEKSATLGSTSSYANGWDDMVNAQGALVDLFGNELSDTDKAKSPIYVVSDGYFNNYLGAYSTEWHVYQNNGTFIGTINPSVRWVQSADRLSETVYPYGGKAEYLNIYHKLSSFADEYTALQAYKNTPVKITFEEEIRNESGQSGWDGYNHNSNDYDKAKRSDGLWLYSFNGTRINANTVIEYSDDDGATYTEDPYVTGTKTSTLGMKAYFTNDDFNGETSVETRSNNEDFFKFTAESAGEYIFVGWYNKEMDGSTAKYMRISTAVNGQSSMESGGTFVARFIKNPSGQLTLSHTILKDDNYKGDGTATIKVEVKDAENTVVKTYNGITTGESEFTIPNTYIKYNHGYTLTVTLNTVPKDDDTFAQFTTSVNSKFYNNATESIVTNPATSVFSFAVNDLFEYDSVNDHYNQTTKVLRYYSQLNQIQYTYSITYAYTSYRSLHNTQRYVVNGTFSESDIANYLEKSDSVYDEYTKKNVTAYAFKDADSKAAFINKYGPYENNFMIDLEWNTGAVTPRYNSENRSYTIDVNPTPHEDYYVDLKFSLPYAHTSRSSGFEPTSLVYDRTQSDEPIPELNYNSWWAWNGVKKYGTDKGDPKFVTAPATLTDGGDTLYFRYWSVKTVPNDKNYSSVEYTKCYSREFNFAIFQDTIVEPIYTKLTDKEIADGYVPTPHAEAIKGENANGATITFIENSRNQYNNDECGDNMKATRTKQGDRIYTDFLLSFANTNDTMYQTYSNGTYTAGLLIERVDTLGVNKYGDYETKTDSEYKTMYDSQLTQAKINDIKTFLSGSSSSQKDGTGVLYQRSEFDANKLDNKNRIQYYYSISTRNHSGDFVDNGNKNYVYRAYSYIKNAQGTVELLSTPIYFTIYDMASITNAAEGLSYDGL